MTVARTLLAGAVLVVVLLAVVRLVVVARRRPDGLGRFVAPSRWSLVGVLWMLVNKAVEGPLLLVVVLGHGLTVADLLERGASLLECQRLPAGCGCGRRGCDRPSEVPDRSR